MGDADRWTNRAWGFASNRRESLILMLGAGVLAFLTVVVATRDNALAAGILQGITIVLTVYASRVFAKESADEAAIQAIKPHALSALRRMRNLWEALGRQRDAINVQADRLNELRNGQEIDFEHVRSSLITLDMMVTEQIRTADDALDDWRELVPEEVERIEQVADSHGDEDV